jgi:hypothetical protein
MTLQEHLLENALVTLENEQPMQDFMSKEINIEMAEETGIKLEDIWLMAQYVIYNYCNCCDYKRGI